VQRLIGNAPTAFSHPAGGDLTVLSFDEGKFHVQSRTLIAPTVQVP
jgi:hypothetical protein